jgi:hypothetical protein
VAFAAGSPEAASDVVERGGAVGCDFAAKSIASMLRGRSRRKDAWACGGLSAVSPDS